MCCLAAAELSLPPRGLYTLPVNFPAFSPSRVFLRPSAPTTTSNSKLATGWSAGWIPALHPTPERWKFQKSTNTLKEKKINGCFGIWGLLCQDHIRCGAGPGLLLAIRGIVWWDSEPIAGTVCFVTTPCEICIPWCQGRSWVHRGRAGRTSCA